MPMSSAAHRLDHRRPLVLDTRELGRRPGSLLPVRREVPAPADLGGELVGVPEGADLALDLRMESVTEGVLVSGAVTAPISGECSRCLEPISDTVTVDLQELFAYPDSATDETTDSDEVSRIEGDLIDLEPTVRDAVVLALPLAPLCRADCPGLCPGCGQPWDTLPAGHSHEQTDSRWSALSALALAADKPDRD